MLLITAAPIEPPIVRRLALVPLAAPVWVGGTAWTTSVVIEAKARPMAKPRIADDVASSQRWVWASARAALAMVLRPAAAASWVRGLSGRRPLRMPARNMVTSMGSISSPASVGLAAKPFGDWMSWGRNAQVANMAAPKSKATVLVGQTAGRRSMRMSISGLLDRSSTVVQAAMPTAERASRVSTRGDVQPHAGAWLTASRSATSQPDSSAVAAQLMRPGVRTGDGGTQRHAASVVAIVTASGIQKSHRTPRVATTG